MSSLQLLEFINNKDKVEVIKTSDGKYFIDPEFERTDIYVDGSEMYWDYKNDEPAERSRTYSHEAEVFEYCEDSKCTVYYKDEDEAPEGAEYVDYSDEVEVEFVEIEGLKTIYACDDILYNNSGDIYKAWFDIDKGKAKGDISEELYDKIIQVYSVKYGW